MQILSKLWQQNCNLATDKTEKKGKLWKTLAIILTLYTPFLSLFGTKNRVENLLQSRKLIRTRACCCKIHLFLAKRTMQKCYTHSLLIGNDALNFGLLETQTHLGDIL